MVNMIVVKALRKHRDVKMKEVKEEWTAVDISQLNEGNYILRRKAAALSHGKFLKR